MNRSDSPSLQRTLALAAALAALGALAGAPRHALAFTLLERPAAQAGSQQAIGGSGGKQGMGDGSASAARKGRAAVQSKAPGSQAPAPGGEGGLIGLLKPGGQAPAGKQQLPAVQKK